MILPISVCSESKAGSKKRSRSRAVNCSLVSATLGMPLRTVILAIAFLLGRRIAGLGAPWAPGNCLQGLDVPRRGGESLALDGAVVADQLLGALGQCRAS